MNFDSLARLKTGKTHRTSSYDRTGGNIDALTDLAPGDSAVLLDTAGPGKITHLWMTLMELPGHDTMIRDMVLRIYWEGSAIPSVEVPVGDFFGLGHGLPAQFYAKHKFTVSSAPTTVGESERALNCYWPMPFHRAAKIEIHNNGPRTLRLLYFHVDYELGPQPADSALFHAAFRQELNMPGQVNTPEYVNLDGKDNFLMLETEGRGHYVGCFFYVDTDEGGWWGEGDDMIFIDHDPMPTIYGTGSEDYFNNAWGFRNPFSFPYYGAPLLAKRPDGGEFTTLYRFHLPDPVLFETHIRVTMEKWWETTLHNCFTCVVFWYQDKPVTTREPLPRGAANHPRRHPLARDEKWNWGEYDHLEAERIRFYQLEEKFREQGLACRTVSKVGVSFLHHWGVGTGLVIMTDGTDFEIALPVPAEGRYRVEIKPLYALIQDTIIFWLPGGEKVEARHQVLPKEDDGAFLPLGETQSVGGEIRVGIRATGEAPLQAATITRIE
jgi:hypothetical protein